MAPRTSAEDDNNELRLKAVENAVIALNDIVAELTIQRQDIRRDVADGIVSGFHKAIDDEVLMAKLWVAFGTAMQKKAREGAGGWILGIVKNGVMWALVFMAVASFVGWLPAWKLMQGAKP